MSLSDSIDVDDGRCRWPKSVTTPLDLTIPPLSLISLPANATARSEDSTTLAIARPCTVADSRERG